MTTDVRALRGTLADLTMTLLEFKTRALRLNEELAHLDPASATYRAKQLEHQVAVQSWVQTEQSCEAQKRAIERVEALEPERTHANERILTNKEIDMLLGVRGNDDIPGREAVAERDEPDRDR